MSSVSVSSSSTPPNGPSSTPAQDNAAWHRLMQLEQAITNLQMQNAQLLQQQQAAAAAQAIQAPHAVAVTGGVGSSSRPKAPPMVTFNGMMGSSGFAIDHWLREVNKQFVHFSTAFVDGATKIKFAVSWLTGPALDWWENEEKDFAASNNGATLTDWNEFVERLRDRYRPQLPAELARQRLRTLTQKGRVDSYCNQFLNIVAHIPNRSEEDKIFDFKNGLDRPLAAKVAEKQPKTLQEAMEIAVQAEPYVSTHRSGFGGFSGPRGNPSIHHRPNHGAMNRSNPESVPMDINAALMDHEEQSDMDPAGHASGGPSNDVPKLNSDSASSNSFNLLVAKLESMENRLAALNSPSRPPNKFTNNKSGSRDRIPGLTAADISALQKEGRCFRCRQKGHMKNECPQNRLKY